jgi:uncharacterized protein YdeI (YjbR/CyaY-like superfamily)
MHSEEVTKYIEDSSDFAKPILLELRRIVHIACPDVEEYIKWNKPNYYYKGKGMCFTDSPKGRVTFGFWFEQFIYESDELSIEAKEIKEKLGFLTKVGDIPNEKLLIETVKLAMKVIDSRKQINIVKKIKPELVIPNYVMKELKLNKSAKVQFESFSVSQQREYIDWIVDAKTENTRNKRITQMIEQLLEGKSKNWKYK